VNERELSANHRGLRTLGLTGAAVVLAMAGAACSSGGQPTPIYVIQTPTASATVEATETIAPTDTPDASLTLLPTLAPTDTPAPTSSSSPTPAVTPVVSSGPTSPAAFCTGKATNQAEFANTANKLKFDVYCARLGKGWGLSSWSWSASGTSGLVTAHYKGPGSSSIDVSEGHFTAYPDTGTIGAGSFGGLAGTLKSTADGFGVYVNPGASRGYQVIGHNMSQSTLVAIAAAMKVIPKS
jgi:hypothetical protein